MLLIGKMLIDNYTNIFKKVLRDISYAIHSKFPRISKFLNVNTYLSYSLKYINLFDYF